MALVAVGLLLLAGCTAGGPDVGGGSPRTAGSAPAPATPTFTPSACPFARDDGGGVRVDCGTVAMAADRSDPGAGAVQLAVAVLRSPSPTPAADPVVYLEGGPGGSALAGIEQWTDPPSPLLAERDVILLDQRGAGYSTPRLDCTPEMDRFDAGYDDRRDEEEDADAYATSVRSCHDRLAASGIDLADYTTAASAADVDDVRRALGVTSWNLFGISYGTRLALQVLADHPAGVRSVVLDSVYPAGVEGLADQAPNGAAAFDAVFAACAADAGCSRDHPDLRARFTEAVARLDRRPAEVPAIDPDTGEELADEPPDVVAGSDLVGALFDSLYDNEVIPDVPDAVDLAASGDVAGALDLFAGAGIPDDGTGAADDGPDAADPERRPDDSDGLFVTITCAEDVPSTSADAVDQAADSVPDAWRDGLTGPAVGSIEDCASWPVPAAPVAGPTRSDVPVLLLAGTFDPITPPRWAEQAAAGLSRARVVVIAGAGHAAIDSGPCPADLVTRFIADPARGLDATATPACAGTLKFR